MKQTSIEIGSEFWEIETCDRQNRLFSSDVSWFLSGRSALKAIIADIKRENAINSVATISLTSYGTKKKLTYLYPNCLNAATL